MQHTGYTSYIIDKNLKASEFLKLCMRAFNIFIEYREEPLSPNIPKELPKDDWHEKELVKAKEKLAQRLAMTDGESLSTVCCANSRWKQTSALLRSPTRKPSRRPSSRKMPKWHA